MYIHNFHWHIIHHNIYSAQQKSGFHRLRSATEDTAEPFSQVGDNSLRKYKDKGKKLSDRQRRKDKKSENNEETPWSEREQKKSPQSWKQVFPHVVHGGLHQSIYLLCNLWRTPHQSRWIYPEVTCSSCRGPAGTVLGWLQHVERITPWARWECKEGEAESYGVTTFPMVPEPLRVGRN